MQPNRRSFLKSLAAIAVSVAGAADLCQIMKPYPFKGFMFPDKFTYYDPLRIDQRPWSPRHAENPRKHTPAKLTDGLKFWCEHCYGPRYVPHIEVILKPGEIGMTWAYFRCPECDDDIMRYIEGDYIPKQLYEDMQKPPFWEVT